MNNIVAFGASSSTQSINKQLAQWAADQLKDVQLNFLDLNDFEMSIFSVDRERENGVPEKAKRFKAAISEADGIIISFAEHNGSYSSAFKNVFDWMSRLEKPIWSDKPMFLLATSPGPRGASGVLSTATNSFPYQGGKVVASFSLPSFGQNFKETEGINSPSLKDSFQEQLSLFNQAIHEIKVEAISSAK
jgi:NAD(P)H-dependent FMN reductase